MSVLPSGMIVLEGTVEVTYIDHAAIRRANLAAGLRAMGVSQAIVERVMRLNPNPDQGQMPRGIHFKRHYEPAYWEGWVPIRAAEKRFGTDVVAAVPKDEIRKSGRRRYVHMRAVQRVRWELGA